MDDIVTQKRHTFIDRAQPVDRGKLPLRYVDVEKKVLIDRDTDGSLLIANVCICGLLSARDWSGSLLPAMRCLSVRRAASLAFEVLETLLICTFNRLGVSSRECDKLLRRGGGLLIVCVQLPFEKLGLSLRNLK